MNIFSILIDLALFAILLICVWGGYRKGAIISLAAMLALIISLIAANFVATRYSHEFTSMLEPFVSGIVDKGVNSARSELGDAAEPYELCRLSLENIGITRSAAANIASDAAKAAGEDATAHEYKKMLVDNLCSVVAYVLALTIVFILVMIFFTVLGNLINLEFNMPGLELINGILGVTFGLVKGLIFVFALAWLARFSGLLLKESVVEKTLLLRLFMNANPLTGIFGI